MNLSLSAQMKLYIIQTLQYEIHTFDRVRVRKKCSKCLMMNWIKMMKHALTHTVWSAQTFCAFTPSTQTPMFSSMAWMTVHFLSCTYWLNALSVLLWDYFYEQKIVNFVQPGEKSYWIVRLGRCSSCNNNSLLCDENGAQQFLNR